MQQYNSIKVKHPDAILLFRVGDFYETFGKDAEIASKELGIVLTKRSNGSSNDALAGFPYHSLDNYLPKLVRAGHRVAICEQLEDAKLTKKIVKRDVTELVTPGVSFNDNFLNNNKNNFLSSIFFEESKIGISFLDVNTGEFFVAEGDKDKIDNLLATFSPSEILVSKKDKNIFLDNFGTEYYKYLIEDWIYEYDFTRDILLDHFKTKSLKGYGVDGLLLGQRCAGVILNYLNQTHHNKLSHINQISRFDSGSYMWLDKFTIKNLELIYSNSANGKSLLDLLDFTNSSMGSRLLRKWIVYPLINDLDIKQRLEIVDFFVSKIKIKSTLIEEIKKIGDLERLASKISTLRVNPREIFHLKISLKSLILIKNNCIDSENSYLQELVKNIDPCLKVIDLIESIVKEDPPVSLQKGGFINNGINQELDDLRDVFFSSKDYLNQMLEKEISNTGISSLKIAYNNVFGYYLEVRNTHKEKVPEHWIRKQTLVSAERYITEELKEYESKILGAEEKIIALENSIFQNLISDISYYINVLQVNANIIAHLDCLISFADVSEKYHYVKPKINNSFETNIKNGRHPVIESQFKLGEVYIPNDILLDNNKEQILMITGPNMSGKSAILRQTALITLMAQIGCFVPADKANLGIVDKIFSRVGASDNISLGESTFMVEMNETASILNNISERSLILLDEIGRGTSTYDGISIAWSIASFLHDHKFKCKTLFATHYHELNDMSNQYDRIKNYHVTVKEIDNSIIFLRKLVPGGTEHSFGIQVAKMAGVPKKIIDEANDVLKHLESNHSKGVSKKKKRSSDMQLSFIKLDDPILEEIRDILQGIEVDNLTPLEALNKLNELKKLVKK